MFCVGVSRVRASHLKGIIRTLPPTCSVSGIRTLSGLGAVSGARTVSGLGAVSGARTVSGLGAVSGARTLSGLGAVSGVRTVSGLGAVSGVRTLSGAPGASGGDSGGVGGVPGASGGWYSELSDSAPVHLCEDFLVTVQQVSGLPWWLSIAVATLSVRTMITLPLAAYQMVIISKVEALQVEISELAKKLRYQVSVRAKERGWTEKQSRFQFQKNLRHLVSQLYIRDNCHPFKASLLVWVQIPLWVSLSLALRNLSLVQSDIQAQLAAGGALWFPDLTVPDSTWILPVFLGLTNLLLVEVFSLQRVGASSFQRLVLNLIRGFSVLMVPISAMVPSSMALYWFTSSLVGFSHNLVLRSPAIRQVLGLQTGSQSPYRDLMKAFTHRYFGP